MWPVWQGSFLDFWFREKVGRDRRHRTMEYRATFSTRCGGQFRGAAIQALFCHKEPVLATSSALNLRSRKFRLFQVLNRNSPLNIFREQSGEYKCSMKMEICIWLNKLSQGRITWSVQVSRRKSAIIWQNQHWTHCANISHLAHLAVMTTTKVLTN